MASKHLAPEQENFVRLSLACVDEVRIVLGDILYSQIPAADLFKEIQSNTALTTGNQKLTLEQLSICYKPGPIAPKYHCFDITLLYKLIRNLCPTLQPSQGWGYQPHQTDIQIGHDIERLRIFRNEMIAHAESSIVPDNIFDTKWDEVENTFKRIQRSAIFKGTTKQFVEHLSCVKRTCFGWQDFETTILRLFFESNNLTDIPKLRLSGDEEKLCGDTACFRATYDDVDASNNWPVIWQRIRGNTIEQIDISTKRYKGSSSQQLVIQRVTKDDEGEYRATVLREVKGTPIEIPSISIHLTVIGDLPYLEIDNALSEEDGVSIHYIVSVDDQSPPVESIVWTKDGKPLETNTDKYSGGEFGDTYLKIHSPTATDIGQYSCEVSNAVGFVKKHIDLDIPSISIDEDPEVIFGKDIAITGTIHSRPTPVSVLWQKDDSLDFENLKILDINDSKYYGSKDNPEDPKLVILKTTHDDGQYYRLVVSNRIGENTSNTTFLKLLGDVPSLSVHHHANIEEGSVTLICEITLPIHCPEVMDFYWTKDDKKIDIGGSGGKYTGGEIADPSLTIKAVTLSDKGKYQCCASNLIGSKRSEAIELDLPAIKFDKPHLDEGDKATYSASIISIPIPYAVEWKVRQDPNGDFRALYIHDPLYRGSSVALPHPTLVVNKYKAEEQQSFQLEVHNFIGSSQKSTKDIAVERSNVGINQEVLIPSNEFYSKRGSGLMFVNLSDNLAMAVPENKLKRLKHILFGYNNIDKEAIKKVKSVRELFMLLQENNLFTETDVLFVQILLKLAGCETLSEKCYQYAEKQKALCYFEKPPENGFIQVHFHVNVPLELYSPKEREDIKETVIAFLGCGKEDVYIQKISPDNNFIIVFAIKQKYSNKIAHIDHKHIQKLCDLKVDYFVFDNERYSTEEHLKETLPEKEEILLEFYKWLKDNYKNIEVVRLYIGKQHGRESKSTDNVIVLVIDGFNAIKEESYSYEGKDLPIICKLWKFLPVKEVINIAPEPQKARKGRSKSDVESCVQSIAKNLFEKHSNLEIVSASAFRLKDTGEKTERLSEHCIVLYCSCKGIVPLCEKEFPKEIEGIYTDVREGFFHLFTNGTLFRSSKEVLKPLLMGASISKEGDVKGGTLGGFVTLDNGNIGFITCAHVLHDLSKPSTSYSDNPTDFNVVQPSHGVMKTNEVCGKHYRTIFPKPNGCTIDAALVELGKSDRVPSRGLFAELTAKALEDNGYSMDDLPEYSTGDIRDSDEAARKMLPCVKLGAESGFTTGRLCVKGTAARFKNEAIIHKNLSSSNYVMYYDQLEIQGYGATSFALPGDSGALVFQLDPKQNVGEDHRLHCIGMVVGGIENVNTIVTPIQPILDALQVQMHQFTQERMDDS